MKEIKEIIQKILFIFVILLLIGLLFGQNIIIELWNIQSGRPTMLELAFDDIMNDLDSFINTNKYNKILNEYIDKRFGNSLSKKIRIIKNYGWRYEVKFDDIMDETCYISYFKGLDGCSDNFDKVISKDKKFQHLYSEWVKKQIGIEDENVELGFAANYDKPYIDFNKITSLSEDYHEVFENTHNLYCWLCEVSNIKELNIDNKLELAKQVREAILLKAVNITNIPMNKKFGGRIYLSSDIIDIKNQNTYVFDFDIKNLNDNLSKIEERHYQKDYND